MRKTYSLLVLGTWASLLGGCQGAIWGNLLVLGITVGIFFGTLALGRSSAATASAEASTSTGSTGRPS
ncbi:MAG: hypothetical protein KF729_35555 [Sandaracinaceae bacterium]|nr:hypothetical protein [Sandaracinaceae bacterium]